MDDDLRRKRNNFIFRSFRDLADCDYIAARSTHRLKLYDQFSWSALQAIEKYLKSIILFYDGDTRNLGHDLIKSLDRVETIKEINWDFDANIRKFLEYLTIYGSDRYFSFPRFTEGNELILLDYSIWNIRRYCEDFYWLKALGRYDSHVKWIQSKKCEEVANKFRLYGGGYLEKVLENKKLSNLREVLVYKNLYYGKYKKRSIKIQVNITSSNPSHFNFPELYSWLISRVKMPPGIIDHLERKSKGKK